MKGTKRHNYAYTLSAIWFSSPCLAVPWCVFSSEPHIWTTVCKYSSPVPIGAKCHRSVEFHLQPLLRCWSESFHSHSGRSFKPVVSPLIPPCHPQCSKINFPIRITALVLDLDPSYSSACMPNGANDFWRVEQHRKHKAYMYVIPGNSANRHYQESADYAYQMIASLNYSIVSDWDNRRHWSEYYE